MGVGYEIHKSIKAGFKTKESYLVTRGRTSFLRIIGEHLIGEHSSYRMMTATADEDCGDFLVCKDKVRLTSAALQFGTELDTQPSFSKDTSGREFVHICTINIRLGGTPKEDEDDLDELYRALSRFFEIYDASDPSKPEQLNELREIYQALAQDDSSGDVYLSDGVWLSSDGLLHDRGR